MTILAVPEGNIVGRITVSDGLPSNRVTDMLRVGDKLCFACASFYTEGGVAILDPSTAPGGKLELADLQDLIVERLALVPPLR